MSKEIEEAARDLIAFWYNAEARVGMDKYVKALDKALNPKPTREECAAKMQEYATDFLSDYNQGGDSEDFRVYLMHLEAAKALKEKPNKWIKNTGVEPKGTQVVVRLESGLIAEQRVNLLDWKLNASLPVTEYMIIE